nr:glyoxalase/bleomycin resistance/extradiol dioxygenase family protein [Serratia marcescens]
MATQIFVNLPVRDLPASMAFFTQLGFSFNPQFTDDTAACMVVSDTIYVMLLTHDKFRMFTPNPIGDAKQATEVLVCLSQPSRAAVDELVRKAIAGGGNTYHPAGLWRDVRPRISGPGRPYLGIDVYGSRGGAGAISSP